MDRPALFCYMRPDAANDNHQGRSGRDRKAACYPAKRDGQVLRAGIMLLGWMLALTAGAGGSGLNTVVVVNQASSNSCELGNYYCERRQVPPENLLRIDWQ